MANHATKKRRPFVGARMSHAESLVSNHDDEGSSDHDNKDDRFDIKGLWSLMPLGMNAKFNIANSAEFSNDHDLVNHSLPRRWLHFCCNPFTRRYRCRPIVKPILTLVVVGIFSFIFFLIAGLMSMIEIDRFPKCRVQYPSFTYDFTGEAEKVQSYDYPWVELGTPTCTQIDGCYRDDVVTISPRSCDNLITKQELMEADTTGTIDVDNYEDTGRNDIMFGHLGLYYALNPYYQNHRRYVLSRNVQQLSGAGYDGRANSLALSIDPMSICTPIITLADAQSQYGIIDDEGKPLPGYAPLPDNLSDDWENVVMYPCGLQAFSIFNDSFQVTKMDSIDDVIPMYDSTVISSLPDRELYTHQDGDLLRDADGKVTVYPWLPAMFYDPFAGNGVQNTHFMNWMRLSPTSITTKLYAIFDEEHEDVAIQLPVRIRVRNRYNVEQWGGTKTILLEASSKLGFVSRTNVNIYIILGVVSLVICVVFFIKYKLSPRRMGDTRFIGGKYKAM